MNLKLAIIKEFLEARGWFEAERSKRYIQYQAPPVLSLPVDFNIDLPIQDEESVGMEIYKQGLLRSLNEVYDDYSKDDFEILLSSRDTIFSSRIMDEDTKNGSIKLDTFSKVIDLQRKILKNAVNFLITKEKIFGSSNEGTTFLEHSRSLPSAKGSFITKIQLPFQIPSFKNHDDLSSDAVVDKLFSVISFLENEAISIPVDQVNEKFLDEYSSYVNIDLMSSINNFYKNAKLDTVELTFQSHLNERMIYTEGMSKKTNKIYHFIKKAKDLIIKDHPIKFTGYVSRLDSRDPSTDNDNLVIITGEDKSQTVKAYLRSDLYAIALEAHKQKDLVIIGGKAKQSGNQYVISDTQELEVFDS